MNGIGMGGGWLFGLLIAGGIVLLLILLVRLLGGGVRTGDRGRQTAHDSGTARRLLEERYARRELSAEEYQERIRVLGEDS